MVRFGGPSLGHAEADVAALVASRAKGFPKYGETPRQYARKGALSVGSDADIAVLDTGL
jgi:hypothetical protein